MTASIAGCYGHAVVPPPPPKDTRAPLIAPMRGRYTISRAKELVGEETFAITSSTGVWRAEGQLSIRHPIERTQGYVLEIDVATREPIGIEAWIEVVGEKQSVRGRRDEDYFVFEVETLSGKHKRAIPYAQGTMIDFPSPLFNTLVFSLLGPSLKVKKPVRVRTISVLVPQMEPLVMHQSYELHGSEDGARKIAVSAVGGVKPNAFWVRNDGLPLKVRTWIDDGPPFVLILAPPD